MYFLYADVYPNYDCFGGVPCVYGTVGEGVQREDTG